MSLWWGASASPVSAAPARDLGSEQGMRPSVTTYVIFVGTPDTVRPLGIKGLGEISTVGLSAAIANAVYHATGRRIRSLPITVDQLL